jgi:hypothetical protein
MPSAATIRSSNLRRLYRDLDTARADEARLLKAMHAETDPVAQSALRTAHLQAVEESNLAAALVTLTTFVGR